MEQTLIYVKSEGFEIVFDLQLVKFARYHLRQEPVLYLLFKGDLEATKITGDIASSTWRLIWREAKNVGI